MHALEDPKIEDFDPPFAGFSASYDAFCKKGLFSPLKLGLLSEKHTRALIQFIFDD